MSNVDLFLVYEDVQYTKNDYRNRNWLNKKTNNSQQEKIWLTVPVKHESMTQKYKDIKLANHLWVDKQIKTLHHMLGKNKNWENIHSEVSKLFKNFKEMQYLYEINRAGIEFIRDSLNIKTPIKYIEAYPECESPSSRVAHIIKDHAGDIYLSGPSAKNYIIEDDFRKKGIKIEWCDYSKIIAEYTHSQEYASTSLNNPQSILFDLSYNIKEQK